MGTTKYGQFIVRGAASGVLALSSFAQAKDLVVRGVRMPLPIQLRILVKELAGGDRLEITGTGIIDDEGHTIPNDHLTCRTRGTARWVCEAGDEYRRVITRKVAFRPAVGFLDVGGQLLRNGIELVKGPEGLNVVNLLGLDDYLAGLVNGEIRSNYPREAVKAQIIAARSYALATAAERRRAGKFYDLYGTIQDQVYRGAHLEDGKSVRLVRETKGQVLVHLEDILKAYYHAASGGFSELPRNVWGAEGTQHDALAYLAQPSDVDEAISEARWSITLSPNMGLQWAGVGKLIDVRVLKRSEGRRVTLLELVGTDGERQMSGAEFRRLLGMNWLKSTYFYIQRTAAGWLFEGRGYGHGVGLSQLGARNLARTGVSALDILAHYYPYAGVRRIDLDGSPTALQIGAR